MLIEFIILNITISRLCYTNVLNTMTFLCKRAYSLIQSLNYKSVYKLNRCNHANRIYNTEYNYFKAFNCFINKFVLILFIYLKLFIYLLRAESFFGSIF